MPKVGEKVQVWPEPGRNVLEMVGRFLPAEGKTVIWSPWLERKLYTGEIYLTDPRPESAAPAPAAPAPAPAAPESK